jgi:ribonuclease HI
MPDTADFPSLQQAAYKAERAASRRLARSHGLSEEEALRRTLEASAGQAGLAALLAGRLQQRTRDAEREAARAFLRAAAKARHDARHDGSPAAAPSAPCSSAPAAPGRKSPRTSATATAARPNTAPWPPCSKRRWRTAPPISPYMATAAS